MCARLLLRPSRSQARTARRGEGAGKDGKKRKSPIFLLSVPLSSLLSLFSSSLALRASSRKPAEEVGTSSAIFDTLFTRTIADKSANKTDN